MSNDFNGWCLDDANTLARVKYLAVMRGDLDLTNAYGLESDQALTKFLSDGNERLYCVFEVARLVTPNAVDQRTPACGRSGAAESSTFGFSEKG